ncbi:MAG: NfeD family protein [Vicingaceae bacterium]
MEWYYEAYFIWFCTGLLFLLLEIGVPGLIIFFFGIGAWITSILSYALSPSLNAQIIVFLSTSLISLLLFRNQLKKRFFDEGRSSKTLEDEFVGKIVLAITDFDDGRGKVEFKGANWDASSTENIKKGQRVKIVDKESINLIVKSLEI